MTEAVGCHRISAAIDCLVALRRVVVAKAVGLGAMASKPLGGWQFVNISEPKKQKKDEAIRKVVRANAMRDFRKKQKEERQAAGQTRRKPSANEGRPVRPLHGTGKPEESTVVSQYSVPKRRADKPMRNEACFFGAPQLKQLLHNLDSMSLAELTMEYEEGFAHQEEPYTSTLGVNVSSLYDGGTAFSRNLSKAKLPSNPRTLLDSGVDPFNASPIFGNPRYVMENFNRVVLYVSKANVCSNYQIHRIRCTSL